MRNTNNTYKTQGGDNLVINVKENAPLLEYLINNVSESRSKLKATLQGRGIAVNGRMVTQFDYQLKAGDKITISRHKKQNQFKSRYVKIFQGSSYFLINVLDDRFATQHSQWLARKTCGSVAGWNDSDRLHFYCLLLFIILIHRRDSGSC